MKLNRTASIRLVQISTIIGIALIIGGYALWRSMNYARGPHITIFEPLDGASISKSIVTIHGRADRVNKIALNTQPISMDEQGAFSERITLFPGTNVITLTASDQFGRATTAIIRVFGSVEFPINVASSMVNSTTLPSIHATTTLPRK